MYLFSLPATKRTRLNLSSNNIPVKTHKLFYRTCCFLLIAGVFLTASSCKKSDNPVVSETGTMTDVEGNVYKTVKIGNQWWMAENLKVKSYRNGVSLQNRISQTSTPADWNASTTGAYTQYDQGTNPPGLLYNGYAVHDSNNIAPAGWHIPSDEEWKTLETIIGMSRENADKSGWRGSNEGDKLKTAGTQYWQPYESVWATNDGGFCATAGGSRIFDGLYSTPSGIVFMGFWWTSTMNQDNETWYRYLDYKKSGVFRSHESNSYGFSIRCVKD